MKNVEELQKDYDAILATYGEAKKAKDKFVTDIKQNGFRISGKKILADEEAYGAFYTLDYYSHYDGHTNDPIYDHHSGANLIPKETFDGLMNIVKEFQETKDAKQAQLAIDEMDEEMSDLDIDWIFWESRNFFEHFKIESDTHISWEYTGTEDQGELCNGSHVDFKISTVGVIKGIKNVEREERG